MSAGQFDFKSVFGPNGPGREQEADHAEAVQRLSALGIVACTPNEAMRNTCEFFSFQGAGLKAKDILQRIEALTDVELRQRIYECAAAEAGAKHLQQALASVVIARQMGFPPLSSATEQEDEEGA